MPTLYSVKQNFFGRYSRQKSVSFSSESFLEVSKDYCLALLALGGAYHLGIYSAFGLEQSVAKSVTLFKRGAAQGHPKCMGYLGYLLCNSENGVSPHSNHAFTRGLRWARKAADTGDVEAITNLQKKSSASSMCFNCVENLAKLGESFRCSRCRLAWYCSKKCQVQSWIRRNYLVFASGTPLD